MAKFLWLLIDLLFQVGNDGFGVFNVRNRQPGVAIGIEGEGSYNKPANRKREG